MLEKAALGENCYFNTCQKKIIIKTNEVTVLFPSYNLIIIADFIISIETKLIHYNKTNHWIRKTILVLFKLLSPLVRVLHKQKVSKHFVLTIFSQVGYMGDRQKPIGQKPIFEQLHIRTKAHPDFDRAEKSPFWFLTRRTKAHSDLWQGGQKPNRIFDKDIRYKLINCCISTMLTPIVIDIFLK